MSFGAPLTSVNRQHYAEAPNVGGLSTRDPRLVSKLWHKARTEQTQNYSTNRALAKLQQDMTRVKHRVLGMAQSSADGIMPFSLYQNAPSGLAVMLVSGGTGYGANVLTLAGGTLAPGGQPTQITVTDTSQISGIITQCYVSQVGQYTTQPTFPNSPTVTSGPAGTGASVIVVNTGASTISSRMFSMRGGFIGLRSRFEGLGAGLPGTYGITYGNYKTAYSIPGDGLDPLAPAGPIIGIGGTSEQSGIAINALDTPVLIQGIKSAGDDVLYQYIFVNKVQSDSITYRASFWLQVTDDATNGFYVNLMAQSYSDTAAPFPLTNTGNPYPNIIPVGLATWVSGTNEPTFVQYLLGNQMTLFDAYFNPVSSGTSALAAGTTLAYRGDWDADSLDGQFFYPGDLVTQGTAPTAATGGFNLKVQYVCIAYGQCQNANGSDPAINSNGNWLCLTR